MYVKSEFTEQLKMLDKYNDAPTQLLMERTGFSRPTVQKFLDGHQLRSYNQDKLIEAVIKINEEALEKRKSLEIRRKEVARLEFQLNRRELRKRKLMRSRRMGDL